MTTACTTLFRTCWDFCCGSGDGGMGISAGHDDRAGGGLEELCLAGCVMRGVGNPASLSPSLSLCLYSGRG